MAQHEQKSNEMAKYKYLEFDTKTSGQTVSIDSKSTAEVHKTVDDLSVDSLQPVFDNVATETFVHVGAECCVTEDGVLTKKDGPKCRYECSWAPSGLQSDVIAELLVASMLAKAYPNCEATIDLEPNGPNSRPDIGIKDKITGEVSFFEVKSSILNPFKKGSSKNAGHDCSLIKPCVFYEDMAADDYKIITTPVVSIVYERLKNGDLVIKNARIEHFFEALGTRKTIRGLKVANHKIGDSPAYRQHGLKDAPIFNNSFEALYGMWLATHEKDYSKDVFERNVNGMHKLKIMDKPDFAVTENMLKEKKVAIAEIFDKSTAEEITTTVDSTAVVLETEPLFDVVQKDSFLDPESDYLFEFDLVSSLGNDKDQIEADYVESKKRRADAISQVSQKASTHPSTRQRAVVDH